eukprot:Hpha_TRINITY_DN1177_c0_g1::TRINITY_DN1177_c0_g1_i1::g.113078::m.113078
MALEKIGDNGQARGTQQRLAIVLGWWGSTPRHVKKFTDLYAARGYSTTQYIASTAVFIGGPPAHDAAAEAFLATVCDKSPPEDCGDVVVHMLSNNGTSVWLAMQRVARRNPRYKFILSRLKAVIVDSAPGSLSLRPGIGAWLANRPPLSAKLGACGVASGALAYVVGQLRKGMRRRPQRTTVVAVLVLGVTMLLHSMMNRTYHGACIYDDLVAVPHLYLYSREDDLVDFRVVERIAEGRRQRCKDKGSCASAVVTHEFQGSAHVAHLRSFPEQYGEVLTSFLTNTAGIPEAPCNP